MMFKDRQNPQGGIRFLILFVHVMAGVLTAGVIVGWGQLAPILTDAGVYQNHCLANQTSCGAQQSLLGNMFNYGATISIFVQSPSGVFIDFIGPRLTALFGLALFVPGCLMFAFSTAHLNMYLVGFLCISAGGPFVFVSIMSTANLFPSNKGVVLMLMNGSYGGGALVFLLFNWLFNHYHYSIKTLFIAYAILSGLITIVVAITWPLKKYTSTEDEILNQSQYPLTKWQMFKRDAFSIQYLFLVLFTGIMVLKSNFYLGNSDTILAMISNDADLVDLYSKIFGLMLPIIGFIVGPIGLVIDKIGLNAGAFFLLFLSALASITGMIHNMKLQIVTFIAFSMYFPYIYGFWATFLIMKFGFENYGVLYAGVAIMAGIMNLAGTPLANLANEGDVEHHMFKINLGLLIGSSAFIIYPIVSVIYNASRKSKDEAHQRLLSNIQTRNVEY